MKALDENRPSYSVKKTKQAIHRGYVYAVTIDGSKFRIYNARKKHGVFQVQSLATGRWRSLNPGERLAVEGRVVSL